MLEERNGSGVVQMQYVWSPVYVNAMMMRYDEPDDSGDLTRRLSVVQDNNWNVVMVMDDSADVLERYQYDPYGSPTFLDGSFTPISGNTSAYNWVYLFQGGRFDPTTGLYLFEHRDENPTLDDWVEQDPSGYTDGNNLYTPERDNSVNKTDYAGLNSGATSQPAQDGATSFFNGITESPFEKLIDSGGTAVGWGLGDVFGGINDVGEWVFSGGLIAGKPPTWRNVNSTNSTCKNAIKEIWHPTPKEK